MHLTISYSDGRLVEAVVLAAGPDRMRISTPESEDTIELRMEQAAWISENGERVEIESMVLGGELSTLFPELCPAVRTASGCGVI